MTTGASVFTPGLAVDSMMLGFQSCKFIRVCMICVLFNPCLLHTCLHLFLSRMYSTWATTDQTRGIQEGFLFDEQTLEPRIGTGFERAMNIWKDLWPMATDACITSAFVEGRCAIVSIKHVQNRLD